MEEAASDGGQVTGALVTPVQAKALQLIADRCRSGFPMTWRELGKELGIRSKNRVSELVYLLRDLGAVQIDRGPSGIVLSRSLRTTTDAVVCLPGRCTDPKCGAVTFTRICPSCKQPATAVAAKNEIIGHKRVESNQRRGPRARRSA